MNKKIKCENPTTETMLAIAEHCHKVFFSVLRKTLEDFETENEKD